MTRGLVTIALILISASANAESFVATFVPRSGVVSGGTGSATLELNVDENAVTYSITVSGLAGLEEAAHIHRADGSVAYGLAVGSTKDGVWHNPGLIDVASLKLGRLYILIHTSAYPSGELRANIAKQEVPVQQTTWSRVKALYQESH